MKVNEGPLEARADMLADAVTKLVDHPCIKHVTPEMTLRYANLASDTIRDAYDAAITKTRTKRHLLIASSGGTFVPEHVDWLHTEMIKTRVAHGYCSRHPEAGACPYANICEQCHNYTTAPGFAPALQDQLADIRELRDDAAARGWDPEVARHDRVITSIDSHLRRLRAVTLHRRHLLTPPPRAG